MHSYPAIKGKIGSTEYYIVTMKASDAVSTLTVPAELDNWVDIGIEEKYQREINYNRVKKSIAPYLAKDSDRFFGALIVDIMNPDGVEFEPLKDVVPKLPKYYSTLGSDFGVLHLKGGEVFVPLDGQHRLKAIQFAISGKDQKDNPISGFRANPEVGNDDITMIFVLHDDRKARLIFNKVNRYAKATTKAENLISSDDDYVAVLSRRIANEFFTERLVNWKSNTLSKATECFTTLNTIYVSTKYYLENVILGDSISVTELPNLQQQELLEEESGEFWDAFAGGLEFYKNALSSPDETGDEKRIELREDYILGKPVIQVILAQAITRCMVSNDKLGLASLVKKANKIDWSRVNSDWDRLLLNGERVISGKPATNLASRVIARMLGEKLDVEEEKNLLELYQELFDDGSDKELPGQVS